MAGITDFIEREFDNGEECMEAWNVGVIGANGGEPVTIGSLTGHMQIKRTKIYPGHQSRLGEALDAELQSVIYIKALMGARDLLVDVDASEYKEWMKDVVNPDFDRSKDSWRSVKRYRQHALGGRPMLLLYPIDRKSSPKIWPPLKPLSECVRVPLLHGLKSPDDLPLSPLGIGIVFPEVTSANASHFLRVKLNRQIEGEELDDSDIEQIEKQGEDEP
jgi:hypothetical protein